MHSEIRNGVESERAEGETGELLYPIGEASRQTGISHGLLRLWEREGLIYPRRTPGGHRFYTVDHIVRLRQIAHLRRVERLNTAAIRKELGPAEKPLAAETTDNEQKPGLRLRALRLEKGFSLAEIAERTGLSTSFLSAVERGQSSISLGNLFKLADAYDTTVPGLSQEYRRELRNMLHPEDRPRFVAGRGSVIIEDLISTPGALEAQRIEIQPSGGSEEPYAHPGEEFIYVIAGQLAFWIDEHEQYNLRTGDSLYFHSTRLHRWRNDGETTTTVLWINVPLVDTSTTQGEGRLAARWRSSN